MPASAAQFPAIRVHQEGDLSSVLSIVIGYVGMAVIVMIGTAIAAATLIPGGFRAAKEMKSEPPRSYLYANLALSFVGALFGGWLCARRAPFNPMIHVDVLAILLAVMSLASSRSYSAKQPSWYPRTITFVGFTGVLLGGLWEIVAT